ncbi:molybdenum cofactor guanylyltransferase MobA [Marivibrio halodurans]|uniref:Molybdenum cofactor guanylyltransferase n=1 Tax=Marivibrio halodurans TaxID=2039722 RepID=A0A8J7SGZ3_9PROT|nr:molybdenum cofactor guanylyltransferase MobA [Marivibrio halodurans]
MVRDPETKQGTPLSVNENLDVTKTAPVSTGVVGIVLAGGLSSRMGGGDKSLRLLGGRPILDHIIERVRPQVDELALNANGDPERFEVTGMDVLADTMDGQPGPLAGVLAGLEWARRHHRGAEWLATFPGDAPFLPRNLVPRLMQAVERAEADMACAASDGRAHPVVGLWPVRLADDLRQTMLEEDIRKVDRWTRRFKLIQVEFAAEPVDPFFNANAPGDIEAAERLLRRSR